MPECNNCGVNNNYGPVQIDISGIKCMPYAFTRSGIFYRNGQQYVGANDGESENAPTWGYPNALNLPKCCAFRL